MNIITSTKNSPYNEFFADGLDKFEEYDIKGIAIVALTDKETLTGYWNMSLADISRAKSELELDIIDRFIINNADRYSEILDEETED